MGKVGRPSKLTPEMQEAICAGLASGLLAYQVAEAVGIPASTISEWKSSHPEFRSAIARATELGFEAMAARLLELPNTASDVKRARLLSDNLKWLLAKLKPEQYGERLDVKIDQKVSIRAALEAADARLVRPMCDQAEAVKGQVIDVAYKIVGKPADAQSSDAPTALPPSIFD